MRRALLLSLPGLILAVISGSALYVVLRTLLAVGSGAVADTIDAYQSRWISTVFLLTSSLITGMALRYLGLL